MRLRTICLFLGMWFVVSSPAQAQLNSVFENLFNDILGDGLALSPDQHGRHFLPASQEANAALTPALNSLIAGNISSFPLSSNVAGVHVVFAGNQPVAVRGSMGPIFAEGAETMGAGQYVISFTGNHLTMDRLRGVNLKDMRFTFLHQDLNEPGLGDNQNESDIIDVFPRLNVDANIFVLYATYGVASNLDLSLAIPFVNITMDGSAVAVVNSFTLGAFGQANHHFSEDAENPQLVEEFAFSETTSGIGNIAVKVKYRFPFGGDFGVGGKAFGMAALIDVRVPTGDTNDFLGTGSLNARGMLVSSWQFGDFTPHLNIGYDYRGADLDSDELEVVLGFDQKLVDGLTFALEILGEFDLDTNEAIRFLPGTATIVDQVPEQGASSVRIFSRTNIPDQDRDNTLNVSFGLWIAPTHNLHILGNVIVPLNDNGLRSSISPSAGLSLSF